MSNSSIWPINRTLSGATIPAYCGPGSDVNEGVLYIPQTSRITEAWPSDCLMSYPGHLFWRGSYPSAEMQAVYSTAKKLIVIKIRSCAPPPKKWTRQNQKEKKRKKSYETIQNVCDSLTSRHKITQMRWHPVEINFLKMQCNVENILMIIIKYFKTNQISVLNNPVVVDMPLNEVKALCFILCLLFCFFI